MSFNISWGKNNFWILGSVRVLLIVSASKALAFIVIEIDIKIGSMMSSRFHFTIAIQQNVHNDQLQTFFVIYECTCRPVCETSNLNQAFRKKKLLIVSTSIHFGMHFTEKSTYDSNILIWFSKLHIYIHMHSNFHMLKEKIYMKKKRKNMKSMIRMWNIYIAS